MQLLLRVRAATGAARDLRIEVDAETGVPALAAALAAEVGDGGSGGPVGLYREDGIRIDPTGTVGACGLVSGERLVVGAPPGRQEPLWPGGVAGVRAGGRPRRLGAIPFHRTPYRPVRIARRRFDPLSDIPCRPQPRPLSPLGALAPLAGGLALYAFSRRPEFLALVLVTPIALLGGWWEERRSGGRRFRREAARFRADVAARRAEVAAALEAERRERLAAAPDLDELTRRAEAHGADLWARGRSDPDFLDLRLGLGEVGSLVDAPVGSDGDIDLRREASAALGEHGRLAPAPVVAPLARLGALALVGPGALTARMAASLLLQAGILHSPEDLVIAAALHPATGLADQVKWLPHTRSLTSPLAGSHLATGPATARSLCSRLVAAAQERVERSGGDRAWPRLLVVLDQALEVDAALVARLLDLAPAAGMAVLWLTATPERVPHQAAAVVRCNDPGPSQLWSRDPEEPLVEVEPEWLDPGRTDQAVRALAPITDASSAAGTSTIPRLVPLFGPPGIADALSHSDTGPDTLARGVVEHWLADTGYDLTTTFGLTPDGPFSLDLVGDGPHMLIGGTSGSGKSELLVALVAGLVARHPPSRLNLLFVDYKGGAASSVFRSCPHTVGYVTNLNGALAHRALVSLGAELNRRMRLLEGRAKDLAGMLASHPGDAPASLVIVVDEFATLVKEVPGFIDGMVDVAQRGRSLGIHLILATQRPAGAVNDNILANTTARICLRVVEGAESSSIIGTPDAAAIPVPLKGRGFARLGPGRVVPFQSSYGSALMEGGSQAQIRVEEFVAGDPPVGAIDPGPSRGEAGPTQLDALLAAVEQAHEDLALPTPRRPWLDELPAVVPVDIVLRGFRPRAGRWVLPLGEIDDPEHQRQDTVTVDLEEGGGLLVYGAAGTGKTTVLRTLAATALASSAGGVVLVGLDFGSRGLRCLEPLEACAGVATGDDLEAVTRVLARLEREVARRQHEVGDAENLSRYLSAGGSPLPRVLVLVDGYVAMRDLLTGEGATAGMHGWLDRLHRLVAKGRQVGVHAVITAERPHGVAPALTSAISRRLVLRQVDETALVELGVPAARARGAELGPGRGFLDGGLVQVACLAGGVAGPTDGAAQARRLGAVFGRMGGGGRGGWAAVLGSTPLGDNEILPDRPGGAGLVAVLGVEDVTGDAVTVDLADGSLVVVGPPRSGRSTALAALSSSLVAAGADVFPLAPFGDPAAVAAELLSLATTDPGTPRVLVIDDADRLLEDPGLAAVLDPLATCPAVRVIASVETSGLTGYTMSTLLQHIRRGRRRLLLQPLDASEILAVLGVRHHLRPGLELPPGRGVLVAGRHPVVLQVGVPARRSAFSRGSALR